MANIKTNENQASSKGINFGWIWSEYSVIIAFIIIFAAATIMNDRFLYFENQMNILMQVSTIGVISLGMTVVMLSGGIDLSVGSVLAMAGVFSILSLNASESILIGVMTALAVGALAGLINGLLVAKGRIASFIATLGMMAGARSIALYYSDGGSIASEVSSFMYISNSALGPVDTPIIIFLGLTLIIYILMQKTRFGRYVYSLGSNEKATLFSAIRVDRIKIGVYTLCGFLVGIAALIETSRLNSISSSSSGNLYELDAIAAVIIGGTRMTGGKGKVIGTFFGVLLLGVLNNMMNLMNISPHLQGLVKGLIIVIAVLFQKRD
ncbi:ABC transporter permease [Virgibacillus sp. MSP4-1]|uniref:ABC transporter permease n=1 Tax=Virgibacillus sp. MSP4-1 TaxID=2700081 RepID=UPI0003A3EB9C|nr:ABC transporter permease [Virgibacillus sp. MSP4-1]QHS23313.1 ABC transporter permease [Virgibacillus sp. MSP4-1]